MKKTAPKWFSSLAQFFFNTVPAAQTAPKTEILYHQKILNIGLGIYLDWGSSKKIVKNPKYDRDWCEKEIKKN